MPDAPEQIEESPVVEEVAVEQPVTEDVETEVVEEAPVVETHEPDLRIPLQEERRKRQEYERQLGQLNDPAFIFEQAKKLGLAEGDYAPANESTTQSQDISGQVRFEIEIERAKEKYPEVTSDPVYSEATWALIQKGHSPLQAADIVQKRLDKHISKATETKVKEQVNASAAAEQAKRDASLTDSGATGSSESAELERLTAQSKNWKDPRAQEAAQLELLKMRMRT